MEEVEGPAYAPGPPKRVAVECAHRWSPQGFGFGFGFGSRSAGALESVVRSEAGRANGHSAERRRWAGLLALMPMLMLQGKMGDGQCGRTYAEKDGRTEQGRRRHRERLCVPMASTQWDRTGLACLVD